MILRTNQFLLLILLLFFINCRDTKQTFFFQDKAFESKSYNKYKSGINFTIVKIPNEFLIDADEKSMSLYDQNEVFIYEFLAEDYSNVLKSKTELAYDTALRHFSQNIYQDFTAMNTEGVKINCVGVIHERTFEIRPSQRLILHFDKPDNKPIVTINYTDRLFNAGLITHQLENIDLKL